MKIEIINKNPPGNEINLNYSIITKQRRKYQKYTNSFKRIAMINDAAVLKRQILEHFDNND